MRKLLHIIVTVFFSCSVMASDNDLYLAIENNPIFIGVEESCPAQYLGEESTRAVFNNHYDVCSKRKLYCLSKCEKGSANHCAGLAFAMQSENAPKIYFERLYALGCKLGSISSCTNRAAGIMRYEKSRLSCSVETFRLTCSDRDAWGCTMYGLLLSRGIGVEKDVELALKVLKTGCINGPEDEACKYAKSLMGEILNSSNVSE